MTEDAGKVRLLPQLKKVDPESLVLRGRPRPVTRFRRGVVIGGMAAVSMAVVTLAWVALEPTTLRRAVNGESGRPFERAAAEAIANAPRDYRDVPLLGPPLPGDLGRSIVEQQRTTGGVPSGQVTAEPDPALERATPGQRRAAAEQAARNSSVVVQLPGASSKSSPDSTAAAPAGISIDRAPPAAAAVDKVQPGDWSRNDANPHSVTTPASPWMLAAGTVIPASLLTGLDSDLPGLVLAQVSENVRDSVTGRAILIPQGARLVGRYDSGVRYGQTRVFVIWERILFPDGSSLRIDNMPASDASGLAGLTDRVDGHSWQLIKGVALSSLLDVGSQISFGGRGSLVRASRGSAQQSGSQAGEQAVSKGLGVQPTIQIRAGWPVRVLISEDLALPPWSA
jgi:type IV secretion system protein VirB10